MKPLQAIIVICMVQTMVGCTHMVIRDGYRLPPGADPQDCNPVFVRGAPLNAQTDSVVGVIKLKDSGFSFACGEDDALEIIKREACAMGANVVNITRERRASLLSSCYRANAQLIIRRGDTRLISFPSGTGMDMSEQSIESRSSADRSRNTAYLIMFPLLGVLIGFFVFGQL